eukprot:8219035-Lingulodinium_polyedra.AAC.1
MAQANWATTGGTRWADPVAGHPPPGLPVGLVGGPARRHRSSSTNGGSRRRSPSRRAAAAAAASARNWAAATVAPA